MSDTPKPLTLDDAKHCPICSHIGKEHIKRRAANGNGMVHTYICMNELCRWYDTGWTVQVQANGEIPQRDTGDRNKQFQPLSDGQQSMAQRMIDEAKGQEG